MFELTDEDGKFVTRVELRAYMAGAIAGYLISNGDVDATIAKLMYIFDRHTLNEKYRSVQNED